MITTIKKAKPAPSRKRKNIDQQTQPANSNKKPVALTPEEKIEQIEKSRKIAEFIKHRFANFQSAIGSDKVQDTQRKTIAVNARYGLIDMLKKVPLVFRWKLLFLDAWREITIESLENEEVDVAEGKRFMINDDLEFFSGKSGLYGSISTPKVVVVKVARFKSRATNSEKVIAIGVVKRREKDPVTEVMDINVFSKDIDTKVFFKPIHYTLFCPKNKEYATDQGNKPKFKLAEKQHMVTYTKKGLEILEMEWSFPIAKLFCCSFRRPSAPLKSSLILVVAGSALKTYDSAFAFLKSLRQLKAGDVLTMHSSTSYASAAPHLTWLTEESKIKFSSSQENYYIESINPNTGTLDNRMRTRPINSAEIKDGIVLVPMTKKKISHAYTTKFFPELIVSIMPGRLLRSVQNSSFSLISPIYASNFMILFTRGFPIFKILSAVHNESARSNVFFLESCDEFKERRHLWDNATAPKVSIFDSLEAAQSWRLKVMVQTQQTLLNIQPGDMIMLVEGAHVEGTGYHSRPVDLTKAWHTIQTLIPKSNKDKAVRESYVVDPYKKETFLEQLFASNAETIRSTIGSLEPTFPELYEEAMMEMFPEFVAEETPAYGQYIAADFPTVVSPSYRYYIHDTRYVLQSAILCAKPAVERQEAILNFKNKNIKMTLGDKIEKKVAIISDGGTTPNLDYDIYVTRVLSDSIVFNNMYNVALEPNCDAIWKILQITKL